VDCTPIRLLGRMKDRQSWKVRRRVAYPSGSQSISMVPGAAGNGGAPLIRVLCGDEWVSAHLGCLEITQRLKPYSKRRRYRSGKPLRHPKTAVTAAANCCVTPAELPRRRGTDHYRWCRFGSSCGSGSERAGHGSQVAGRMESLTLSRQKKSPASRRGLV